MRQFKAPEHVTAISTFAGERRADKDGFITVEDDAHTAEVAAIIAAGWTEVAEVTEAAPQEKAVAKDTSKA